MGALWSSSGDDKKKCYVCTVNHVDQQPSYFCTEESMDEAKALQFARDWDKLGAPGGRAFLVPDRGLLTPWWKHTRWPYGTVNQCNFMRRMLTREKEERDRINALAARIEAWVDAEEQKQQQQRAAVTTAVTTGTA